MNTDYVANYFTMPPDTFKNNVNMSPTKATTTTTAGAAAA